MTTIGETASPLARYDSHAVDDGGPPSIRIAYLNELVVTPGFEGSARRFRRRGGRLERGTNALRTRQPEPQQTDEQTYLPHRDASYRTKTESPAG